MIDLRQGDCLKLMKEIPDKSVDMILCDLPYGTTACKWDNIIPFEPLWEQYNRIIKDNGAIVLFGSEPFASKLRLSNLKMYKYDWIWKKNRPSNFLCAKKHPLKYHENILVFYKKQPIYNPQMQKGKPNHSKGNDYSKPLTNNIIDTKLFRTKVICNGEKYPKSILKYNKDISKFHPTQKPVALLEYLIKTYTNENEVILDNCAGSMSTAIACLNTNRNGIMIEKDEHYFEVGCKRIKQHILDNNINLCYNQAKGGVIWQNLKIG